MDVYKVIFKDPSGKHICVVTAHDAIYALELASNELRSVWQTEYRANLITSEVTKLPLLSKNDKEKVIFIEGYEE